MRRKAQRATTGAALKILLIVLFSTSCGSLFHQPGQSNQRFSLASLKGNYTYNVAGMIFNLPPGYNLYHETGAFVADGKGGLTGVDDFASGTAANKNQFTGSYTIGGDGTGTMTINLPGRPVQLAITLRSTTELYLLEYDAFATGTGGAFAQASSAISGTLSGAYVFRFYTHVFNGASSAAVGQMMINGTSVTGSEDVAQIGTITATPGPIENGSVITQPDSNGRGTLKLIDSSGTSNYVYYAIDSNTLNLIRTDPNTVGEGRAVAQTGISFTNASITSGFTFHMGGDTGSALGGVNTVGTFTSDGHGKLTSGSLDSAVGGLTTNETFTATYAFDSTGNFPGRASITVTPTSGGSPINQVAWMADSTQGFMLEEDSNTVAAGAMLLQTGGAFSAASLNGEYAVRMIGFDGTIPPTVGRVGVMTFDGSGTVTFTDLFVNRGGTQQAQYTDLSGPYTVTPNGRVETGEIHGVTVKIIFYLTSNQSAFFLLGDSGAEVLGQNGMQAPQ